MIRLFLFAALLGLAAVDPIGIAVMPVLLAQKYPVRRSAIFLTGSFVSLTVMGMLFALGFGVRVLSLEHSHHWIVPCAETLAAIVLFGVAGGMLRQSISCSQAAEPSFRMADHLHLDGWHLFAAGVLLVVVQSIADVVFIIAMVRFGQLQLSLFLLLAVVSVYAVAALALQLVVVGVYTGTPRVHRVAAMDKVRLLLTRYGSAAVGVISLVLGCLLTVNAVLTIAG